MPILPHFYIESLTPLYQDVQLSELFSDSKFFVDAVPLFTPQEIITNYLQAKEETGFDLKAFVKKHFALPAETDNTYSSANKSLPEHLSGLWNILMRKPDEQGGTLIPLPHSYIVPGGRFREVYYWDSYFTMLGLQVSKRVDIIQNMIDNFAYLIDQVGFIPNGNRTYYLGRSQPPFFPLMLSVLEEEKGTECIQQYLPQLENEYSFWMDGAELLSEDNIAQRRVVLMPDGSILNRYWDDRDTPRPEAYIEDKHLAEASGREVTAVYRHIRAAAESGWDFSSRWFRDEKNMATIQTTDIIPVDLNCLLAFMETYLAHLYMGSDEQQSAIMLKRAEQRKKAIQQYCWNEHKGFYFDHHFIDKVQTQCYSLAGLFPLFIHIADKEQSVKVAKVVEEKFLQPGGLITTLNTTGQQWDAPNGWAPLQWIAYKGLKQMPYGHRKLAEKIRNNWMQNNEKVFAETGKMMEKYNVADIQTKAGGGEYPNQDGFGWTNGVYLKFLAE
jgi:alpha,alpha-trehalase